MTLANRSDACGTGVLLVTALSDGAPSGGRELLSRLTRDALADICGPRLAVLEIAPDPVTGWRSVDAVFNGYIDGLSREVVANATAKVKADAVGTVFIDGSNFGALAAALKREFSDVRVVTYFHNCEARFFLGAFRQLKSVRSLGVLLANFLAERSAVQSSDMLICLNERDSEQLFRLYGRSATHISAMAMKDRMPTRTERMDDTGAGTYALFVGGAFYANQAGICWYAENVASRVDVQVRVVGRGLEPLRGELERHPNIEVVGAVSDLASWYFGARFVIAPIFDGSGMKTKVAEALMFGKRIVGSPEAFTGYEDVADRVGAVCSTPEDFIDAMKAEMIRDYAVIDPKLRSIYQEKYSFNAARARMARILGEEGTALGKVGSR